MKLKFLFESLIILFMTVSCTEKRDRKLTRHLENILESSYNNSGKINNCDYLILRANDTLLNKKIRSDGNDYDVKSCFERKIKLTSHRGCKHKVYKKNIYNEDFVINVCDKTDGYKINIQTQDSVAGKIFERIAAIKSSYSRDTEIMRFGE